jgi:hypothetical protein
MNRTVYIQARFKRVYEDRPEVDGERLQQDVQEAINGLNAEGYEVISLVPVESGAFVGSGGYSFTEGIIVVARRVDFIHGMLAPPPPAPGPRSSS